MCRVKRAGDVEGRGCGVSTIFSLSLSVSLPVGMSVDLSDCLPLSLSLSLHLSLSLYVFLSLCMNISVSVSLCVSFSASGEGETRGCRPPRFVLGYQVHELKEIRKQGLRLTVQAHRRVYHSTPGLSVIKKESRRFRGQIFSLRVVG